jgi:hypothetical protein
MVNLGAVAAESTPQNEFGKLMPSQVVLLEVYQHAITFKRVKADRMEVSVRPDANTEIGFLFTSNGYQIEVEARLEHGDAQSLCSHWSELQHSLSHHNIRLAQLQQPHKENLVPCQSSTDFGSPATNQLSGKPPLHQPDSLEELVLVGSVTEPLKRRAGRSGRSPRRALETWA